MTYSKFSLAKLPTIFLRVLVLLATAQITAISVTAQNSPVQNSSPASTDNPLLTESALPYHLPPFDKIKDEHFVPAIEAGMQEQLKEVDVIANSSDKPTFDNTVVALERTGQLLDRAERTFSNLTRDVVIRTARRSTTMEAAFSTAGNIATVNKLLADLAPPAMANAKREAADIQKAIDQENGGFQVASWDWVLYADKVRKARYQFDESELKP